MTEPKDESARSIWGSLKRGFKRNLALFVVAMVMYQVVEMWPTFFGGVWAPMVRGFALALFFLNGLEVIMRVQQPYLNNRQLGDMAEKHPVGAGIVYASRMIFMAILFFTVMTNAHGGQAQAETNAYMDGPVAVQARQGYIEMTHRNQERAFSLFLIAQNAREMRELQAGMLTLATQQPVKPVLIEMPDNAKKNSPLLLQELKAHWPAVHQPSYNAAQIEQETCVRLTSPVCWTSNAQLNVTSKHGVEKGRGFGQLTAVWRANGDLRFDNVGSMRVKYPKELGNYGWDNWNDPQLSMRAYVLFMRDTCKSVPSSVQEEGERFKMCLSGYNGGMGGLSNDILSCRATKGCNPTKWDGNVELTSAKSKLKVAGYGQSAFEINRGYVRGVTVERRVRYLSLDGITKLDPAKMI